MDASGLQCSANAKCRGSPFGDGVRSLKIVCSPTNTSLNITQISLYYGSSNRAAGDLIAEWSAPAEAVQRNVAKINRNGAAFEASVPSRLDRVNFQYYATFSGIDAAGAAVQSSTITKFSFHTCDGPGRIVGRVFLVWVIVIVGVCVGLPLIITIMSSICDAVGTRHRRLPNNNDNGNNANGDNA
jgi:hypothetical protein